MKDEFKGITPEKFKKYKKGQLGSWQKFNNKTDAGNVELNTAIFNNASTPQASPNTSPVGGGMGESLENDNTSKYGKPFNIYKQSPFKDSIVKSVVYHGASDLRYDLNYKYAREGGSIRGLYFTTDKSWAEHHGETEAYYINITNPLYIPYKRPSQCNVLDDIYDILLKNNISISKDAFYKEWGTDNLLMDGHIVTIILTYYAVGADKAYSYDKSGSVASTLIQNAGYDGIVTNTANDESEITYIVFSRNQVVRADIDGLTESVEDKGSEYGKFNDIIKKIKSLSDEEILKYTDTGLSEGPNFITKNGTFVSGSSTDDDTHLELLSGIIDRIGYEVYGDDEYDLDEDAFIYQELVSLILDHIESERGWIRVNTGSEYTGDTPYIYLNKERPTSAQFDAIEEVLEACESNGYSDFIVYISTSSFHAISKVYPLEDYDSIEHILKNIKRYYASGVLYETVEPQEQLFTEEDVNYLTEWIVDVIDYDIKSTEIELGDGRYVVYTEKERDGGHLFEVVDELNNEYVGSDTTYGKVESTPKVIKRVADSITESIITMIQKYDNSLIGNSIIKEIKEKCMKFIDKGIDDVLILEQVGGYDAIACEFDKKKNSLRVYSVENPTIDLYRGNLK